MLELALGRLIVTGAVRRETWRRHGVEAATALKLQTCTPPPSTCSCRAPQRLPLSKNGPPPLRRTSYHSGYLWSIQCMCLGEDGVNYKKMKTA